MGGSGFTGVGGGESGGERGGGSGKTGGTEGGVLGGGAIGVGEGDGGSEGGAGLSNEDRRRDFMLRERSRATFNHYHDSIRSLKYGGEGGR